MSDLPADSRRTLVGLCLCMGGALVGLASLNYMLLPMLTDLGIDQTGASVALSIPSIGSLLVVFLAGRLGSSRGHRTVITWMGMAFVVGSATVLISQGLPLIVLGLLLQGLGSTAIQIVVFGLLSERFVEPSARASAFGTFGMVSPFIWMLVPVLTGWMVGEVSWRWVAALWVVCGLMILLSARVLLPRPRELEASGEVLTPILAGAAVAGLVLSLNQLGTDGLTTSTVLVMVGTVAIALFCARLLRRLPKPTFTLAPLRVGRTRSLLSVVVIIPLINTIFLMTMAFQYLYGLTGLQTALAMVPAQLAAVLGARLMAGPLMRRIGVTATATLMFAVLAVAMLGSLLIQTDSPLWLPIAYVTVFNVLTVSASITVTSGVLASDPDVSANDLSAYRGSGVAVGQALAVVVMNSIVFGLARLFLNNEFEANGLSQADAASLATQIQASSTSPDVMSQYATPLPSGVETSQLMLDSIVTGLHVNGVVGALLALGCVFLVRVGRRTAAAVV